MIRLVFVFCTVALLFSCGKNDAAGCFNSTGKIVSEHRELPNFNSLEVYDDLEIILIQDTVNRAYLTAGKNLIDGIETKVENNLLVIQEINKCNWVRKFNSEKRIELHVKNLEEIYFAGVSTFTSANTLTSDKLFLNMWKSGGDINLNVDCQTLELKTNTGTGTIHCSGTTESLVVFLGAPGFISTTNLTAKTTLAVNENIGTIELGATQSLNAFIKNKGNIEYVGSPEIELVDTGEGQLIKID